jgi:hypothetical protein
MSGRTTSVMLLVLSPPLFLTCLFLGRTGRDLTTFWLAGCAALLSVGVFLIVVGILRRRREVILSGSGLLVILLVTFFCASTGMWWIGVETRELTIRVIDAETQKGITNASVLVLRRYGGEAVSKGMTDRDGEVHLVRTFTSIGTDSFVQKTGAIYLWQDSLEVNAEGYGKVGQPLDTFTGPSWDLYGSPFPTIEVRLRKR